MNPIHTLDLTSWSGPFSAAARGEAIDAIENGEVLFLPHLSFPLTDAEQPLLSSALSDGKSKNISLEPNGSLKNANVAPEHRTVLQSMMQRFAVGTVGFINGLFPQYAPKLERARTSYRPVEIEGRNQFVLQDDTRLHVDAFLTRPMQRGRRIMRLFTNVNPNNRPRVWHIGEPFADMAKAILPYIDKPTPAKNLMMAALFKTRGVRSAYDNYMHGLHDQAKLHDDYQKACPQIEFAFPACCTWLCYTDQVMHAALSGQYVLEQTFHLDLDAMAYPERAPFNVLERMTGRSLA